MSRAALMTSVFAGCSAIALLAASMAMHDVAITDPVLKMTAWTVAVPAGWSTSGTMLPGSSCNPSTTPVFEAKSGDGTEGFYFLPRVDWAWGAGVRPSSDCLPWTSNLSAKQFLVYEMGVEKVGFVREEQAPQQGAMPPGYTTDAARDRVSYTVGGRRVDETMQATVTCHVATMAVVGEQHACSALVTRAYAPSGKLDALQPTFDAIKFRLDQQWWAAWQNALQQRFRQLTQQQTAALLQQGAVAGAQRMQAHQAYMASAEAGYSEERLQFSQGQYQKQQQSDNFVDYVLDCDRSYNASGTVRVSGSNCPNRQTF